MGLRREISGNDILLFIDPLGGTNYNLIVCLTSNSINRTTNQIDASSKCGASILPGTQTITVPFEFHDVWDTANGEFSEADLHPLWALKTTFSWKYGLAIPTEGSVAYTGVGFLANLNIVAAQNTAVTSSAEIAVQGAITQVKTGS